MRRAAVLACLIALPAFASDRGDWFGDLPAMLVNDPACPVRLVKGGVNDKKEKSKGGQIADGLLGGEDYSSAGPGEAWFFAGWENVSDKPIAAVEVRWRALDAFGGQLGEHKSAYSHKKPLKPGKHKGFGEAAPRIASADHFEISILRVRFEDGSVWQPSAPQPPKQEEPAP